jgi:enamine deaminase RidA (YjgF/YER057c/UK114 family)
MRSALKALNRSLRGAVPVQIRAFVAGSGDMRRVQAIVSEEFTDRRRPLPVLNVIQVGSLPLAGAQVVLEVMAVQRKPVNTHGLAFIAGQASTMKDPAGPLIQAVKKLGLPEVSVRRVTCFLNSLEGLGSLRSRVATAFPKAAANYVQLRRAALDDFAECEAVAALQTKPQQPVTFVSPMPGRYSQAALVGPGKIALTGTQLAFRAQEADIRLAFERLGNALETVGGRYDQVAFTRIYPLTQAVADQIRKIRFEFLKADRPPASTLLLFEGLPSLDASFGIDVIAALE